MSLELNSSEKHHMIKSKALGQYFWNSMLMYFLLGWKELVAILKFVHPCSWTIILFRGILTYLFLSWHYSKGKSHVKPLYPLFHIGENFMFTHKASEIQRNDYMPMSFVSATSHPLNDFIRFAYMYLGWSMILKVEIPCCNEIMRDAENIRAQYSCSMELYYLIQPRCCMGINSIKEDMPDVLISSKTHL